MSNSKFLAAAIISASLISLSACTPEATDRPPILTNNDIVAVCAKLAQNSESDTLKISSSKALTDTGELPPYCQIKGTISPNIGFEARFPLSDWNGRYYQSGCGGYCGVVAADKPGQSNTINFALKRSYATITTDGGHQSAHIGISEWAIDNREAEEVYAHKVLPLTFEAGQSLVKSFYGANPKYNYFSGCDIKLFFKPFC